MLTPRKTAILCIIASTVKLEKMVGSDTRLFSKQMKLRIVTVDGFTWTNEFSPETTTTNVKIMSIGHLSGNDDAEKSLSRYTLFNTRTSAPIRDEQTLADAGVKDGDELLLIPKRNVMQSGSSSGILAARHSQTQGNSLGVASATSSTSAASSLRASLSDSDSDLLREVIPTLNPSSAHTVSAISVTQNAAFPTQSASSSANAASATASFNVQLLVSGGSQSQPTSSSTVGSVPDMRTIAEMTANIEPRNLDRLAAHSAELEATRQSDFNRDIQAISITLIELAQKLLCTDPNATRIYKQVEEFIRQRAVADSVTDRALTKQLVEMGFPELRVREALQICGSSLQAAMEYLMDHPSDEQSSAPGNTSERTNDVNATSSERQHDTAAISAAPVSSVASTSTVQQASVSINEKPLVSWNILELYRKYRYQQFRVNNKAKENLLAMGFDETDVLDTLRACNNDQQMALEILLDENRVARLTALRNSSNNAQGSDSAATGSTSSSFTAFGGGPPVTALDPSSSLHRAIVANPTIQLGLTNPRSLIALLQILENPTQTMLWLNDPDTAPMLIALSRIYHAEKHATRSTSASLS